MSRLQILGYDLRIYIKSGLKYVLSAAPAALVNIGVLYLLTHYFHVWYFDSAIISTTISTVPFFLGLKKIGLFKVHKRSEIATKPARNIVINLVGTGLNWGILFVLTSWLGVWYLLSEVLAIALVFVGWSFPMNILARVIDVK